MPQLECSRHGSIPGFDVGECNCHRIGGPYIQRIEHDYEEMHMKGMLVDVLRRADGCDCTNGGVSSKYAVFVLVGDAVPQLTEASDRYPVLFLERNGNFGYRAVPGEPGWKMFGGNFIYSSDGRFWELSRGPIPIHDRFEESCR